MRNARLTLSALTLALASPAVAQVTDADRAMAREILTELVSIRTAKGQGQVPVLAQALIDRFRAAGFAAEDIEMLPSEVDGERTVGLVVRYRGRDPQAKPIAFLGHMDVVDAVAENWTVPPFTPTIQDGYLYGRGSQDNKAGIAAIATTFIRLKRTGWVPERDLLIAFSGDEETGMRTTRALTQHPLVARAKYALNGDAGGGSEENGRYSFGIQSAEKTFATYYLTARNRGGHSSAPRADNAIYDLAAALTRMSTLRFPVEFNEITRAQVRALAAQQGGELGTALTALLANPQDAAARAVAERFPAYANILWTTCVATMLQAGNAFNALPQNAQATINCRIFPGTTVAQVQQTITQTVADANIAVTLDGEPVESPVSPPNPALFAAIKRAIEVNYPDPALVPSMSSGGTDGREFRSRGIPTYGAGSMVLGREDSRAHGIDERLPLAAFDKELGYWDALIRDVGGRTAD